MAGREIDLAAITQPVLVLGGTVALFAFVLLLFGRFMPVVSMFETRHEEAEAEAAQR